MGIPAVAVDNSSSDPVCESSSENINVTDSMGNLFGQALSEEQDKQNESAGNFIYSVEISDGKAVADYITNEGGLLTVAIYDEEGIQLITSVQAKAEIDTTKMEIPVDKSVMPEYFYIRAFLTDEETLRPLCTVYESPNYTRKMQEFFAKTVDDFEEEKVVNFDNSADNNFAVYSEDTRVIEDDGIHNQLTENNEEEKRYVFSNTDEKISSLSQGDVISYETEGNTVIIKVDTIEQNDSEVVITGQDTSMEEVFDYVKIEAESNFDDITVDTSVMDEGLTYNGVTETNTTSSSAGLPMFSDKITFLDADGYLSKKWSFSLNKDLYSNSYESGNTSFDLKCNISGSLSLELKASVKLYLATGEKSYAEFKTEYSFNSSLTMSGKAEASLSFPLFGISPCPGVYVEITPTLTVGAKGELSVGASVNGCVGFKVSDEKGFENITSRPKAKASCKVNGSYYVGLSLEPKVKIIDDKISKASLKADLGVEVKVERENGSNTGEEIHQCKTCDTGSLKVKGSVSFEIVFANHPKLTFKIEPFRLDKKLFDFYHSVDFNEWGKGKCSHKLYMMNRQVSFMSIMENGRDKP